MQIADCRLKTARYQVSFCNLQSAIRNPHSAIRIPQSAFWRANKAFGERIQSSDADVWRHEMKVPFLLGRLIFGGYFLYAGINHFKEEKTMTEYAAAKNVPVPNLAVKVSGAALVVGGASILLGIKPKWGAATIIGFLAGVSPIMHNFWQMEDAQQRQNDMINFTKNIALAGAGLALASVEEPWPASVPVAQPDDMRSKLRVMRRKVAA
jgi:putative oxidoreductase